MMKEEEMKDQWEHECAALRAEVQALQQQLHSLTAQVVSITTPVRQRVSKSLRLVFLPVAIFLAVGGVLYGQDALNALFIDQQGRVGIGTTAPEQVVDIRSNGKKNPFAIDNALYLGSYNGTVRITNNAYLDENAQWQIKDKQKKAFTLEIRDSSLLELYGTKTNGQTDWQHLAKFDGANRKIDFLVSTSVNGVSFQNALVPVGTIMAYGGDTTNADIVKQLSAQGWLPCNGAAVKREEYRELFQTIKTAFGADDADTFRVPDLRGRFPRGTDQDAGRDPDAASRLAELAGGNSGNTVGSVQDDEFKSHTHGYTETHYVDTGGNMSGSHWNVRSAQTAAAGGKETRPKNIYVNWIIKAKHT
jgi:microcystin-dependent protein